MSEKKLRQSDVEIKALRPYRNFSLEYKLTLIQEMESCQYRGDITRIAERENLDRSILYRWQHAKKAGKLKGSISRKNSSNTSELDHLKSENAKLKEKLSRAEAIIEIQKKISELLNQTD
jgi:transposase